MIEDEELRITFKAASEEHLEKLDEGLLHLERFPEDRARIEDLMREAHSLKGDANMLGVKDVSTLAHQLEHILGTLKLGENIVTPALCDRLSAGLQAIRLLVREAVTGETAGVNTFYILAYLMGAQTKQTVPPPLEITDTLKNSPQSTTSSVNRSSEASKVPSPIEGEQRSGRTQAEKKNDGAAEPNSAQTAIPNPPISKPLSPQEGLSLPQVPISHSQAPLSAMSDSLRDSSASRKSHRYIEEGELRETFKIACEEHLQKLDSGMLHLEKYPNDRAKLEELLREAHSIKGDAGMLGVRDVGTLAHQLENILNAVKRNEIIVTPGLCDRLSVGLQAIRQLVREAVTGANSGVNLAQVHAQLSAPDCIPPDLEVPQQGSRGAEETISPLYPLASELSIPSQNGDARIAFPAATASADNGLYRSTPALKDVYRIETIRVETRNLDALMTQAGELTVTKIRIAHRLGEIEEIVNLWEEWSRDSFVNRFALDELERGFSNGSLKQYRNLHHRAEERLEQLGALVNRLRNSVYEDTARLEVVAEELEEGIRTLRLLPLSTIFNLFPRMVRDLARQEGKEVELIVEGGETRADKRILEEMKDPLMHILRNAIDHGIETPAERQQLGKPIPATIRLRGYQTATHIAIEVIDDGRGLDIEAIKRTALKRGVCREEELAAMTPTQIQSLIFAPGFSTRTFVTEVSGRGVGLDVVRTNVERLKGIIHVESTAGEGCTLRLQLGTTLATAHVLLVSVGGIAYALPVEFVQMARLVPQSDIFTIEGRETIVLEGQPVSVARLAELIETPSSSEQLPDNAIALPCIILKVGEERLGLLVDALLDEQDVVLKPLSKLLKRVRNVAGATILGTGEVCMVLNPQDLIKSVRQNFFSAMPTKQVEQPRKKQVILLVEDSIATRTQEKRILEGAGYEVVTAVDGLDGFNKLKTRSFDAVVSDIQMPNLDGLGLTARIRQLKEYSELPIVLVTSLATDEDKRIGAEAGANAYIAKSSFNQEVLLETLKRLV